MPNDVRGYSHIASNTLSYPFRRNSYFPGFTKGVNYRRIGLPFVIGQRKISRPVKPVVVGHIRPGRNAGVNGKEVVTDALAALSDRSVSPVMGHEVALYIDDWGGTIGTTAS